MCIPFEYSDLELALASLAKDIHTANLEFFWHDEAFSAAWYTNAAFFNFAVIVILSQNQLHAGSMQNKCKMASSVSIYFNLFL